MGRKVVLDQMKVELGRCFLVDDPQEGEQLLMAESLAGQMSGDTPRLQHATARERGFS